MFGRESYAMATDRGRPDWWGSATIGRPLRNGFAGVTEGRNEVEDLRPSPRGINGGDPLGRRPFMPQGAVGAAVAFSQAP